MVNTDISDAVAYTYATSVVDEAERQRVDVALITSVATQESTFIYDAESTASAVGVMGIMPETGRWICKELGVAYTSEILKDPTMSVRMGTWFLNYLMRKYEGNEKLALAHYNGGNKQRNNYIQREIYKNTEEFKLSNNELKGKLLNIKVELIAAGKNKHELRDDETYRYLDDVYAGKTFADETKEYIPEVLTRRDVIKKMLTKPTDTEEEMEAEEESTS